MSRSVGVYQKWLDETVSDIVSRGKTPSLLLHACCAPCSSYCVEYLSEFFNITVFFYNPNIDSVTEYERRVREEERFLSAFPAKRAVSLVSEQYGPEVFFEETKGLYDEPEGGRRCEKCFRLRLEKTAAYAKEKGFDYFTTTLSISPLKDAVLLNTIGDELSKKYDVPYLFSEFKKRGGFLRSTELSKEYKLYRQDYCGCVFSKRERAKQKEKEKDNEVTDDGRGVSGSLGRQVSKGD